MSLQKVKHIILVLSGKGGVGKSSITLQLALTLSSLGHSTGILDIDLTGPSIPRLLNLESHRVTQAPGGWLPVPVHPSTSSSPSSSNEEENNPRGALSCMSLGFLLPTRSSAVIWRGPKKTAMIRQFLSEVLWGPLDYLLIDTPPGTSDEHISLAETLLSTCVSGQLAGAVVVTTPQAVATADVKKELNFCAKTGIAVLGVVENMSGFICPCCGEEARIFSRGGGEAMAREWEVDFLGRVPIDERFGELVEGGVSPVYGAVEKEDGNENGELEGERNGEVNGLKDRDQAKGNGSGHANGVKAADDELLIEKYKSCSLYPIFRGISQGLVEKIEGTATNGGTTI